MCKTQVRRMAQKLKKWKSPKSEMLELNRFKLKREIKNLEMIALKLIHEHYNIILKYGD